MVVRDQETLKRRLKTPNDIHVFQPIVGSKHTSARWITKSISRRGMLGPGTKALQKKSGFAITNYSTHSAAKLSTPQTTDHAGNYGNSTLPIPSSSNRGKPRIPHCALRLSLTSLTPGNPRTTLTRE